MKDTSRLSHPLDTSVQGFYRVNKTIPAVAVLMAIFCSPSLVLAQNPAENRSNLLSALSDCRNLADNAVRLACYDRTAAALDQGEKAGEVVVIDRAQVQAARRDLFGFNMPSLSGLFGRDAEENRLTSVETTLTRAGQAPDGKWVFHLGDGSEWRQIDSMPVRFQNRAGAEVRVRNAALGSYLLTIGGSRAVRVRRQ